MPKITIYVSHNIKYEMDRIAGPHPNWSAVAQDAFMAECARLGTTPLPTDVYRGTRLSPDWQLPEEWRIWAVHSVGVERNRVDRIAENFRDHWIAKSGKDAAKVNWFATWRNWVRKDAEYQARGATKADKRAAVAKAIFGERKDVDITGESERLA